MNIILLFNIIISINWQISKLLEINIYEFYYCSSKASLSNPHALIASSCNNIFWVQADQVLYFKRIMDILRNNNPTKFSSEVACFYWSDWRKSFHLWPITFKIFTNYL